MAEAVSETNHVEPWKALHDVGRPYRVSFALYLKVFRQ